MSEPRHKAGCRCDECWQWMADRIAELELDVLAGMVMARNRRIKNLEAEVERLKASIQVFDRLLQFYEKEGDSDE